MLGARRLGPSLRRAAALLCTVSALGATQASVAPSAAAAHPTLPFGVGEHFEYSFTMLEKVVVVPIEIGVGSGTMDVLAIDTVRGHPAFHLSFKVTGGIPLFRVNDAYQSWMEVESLASLRYIENKHEGRYQADHHFEILPEHRQYRADSEPAKPSVEHPLDIGSFVYFIRTLPLTVPSDTSFDNYFRPERNPVRIHVLGTEHIEVPAGKCDALVLEPTIHTDGLFGDKGHAKIWLSNDANHVMLQMKADINFPGGHLNLYLKSYRLAGGDSTARTPACR